MNTAATSVATRARAAIQGRARLAFRDGRICGQDAYYTPGGAHEAVGLDE